MWQRTLKYGNTLLAVLSVLFFAASGARFFILAAYRPGQNHKAQAESLQEFNALKPMALLSSEEYQALFASKPLFRPLIKAVAEHAQVLTIDDLASEFSLIGIVKQDELEAVVKNIRTQQTFFVRKGSSIGELKVEAVEDEKVIVSYQGATKTLFIQ